MSICKEEPLIPASLELLRINYSKRTLLPRRGQSGRRPICEMPAPNHSKASAIWNGGTSGKKNTPSAFSMSNFVTPGTSSNTPPRRFTISTDKWVFSSRTSNTVDIPSSCSRMNDERTPAQPGGNDIGNRVSHDPQRKKFHDGGGPQDQMEYKDVALRTVTNRWIVSSISVKSPVIDNPEVIDRKVQGFLNKLHPANFDSISDQLITWANKSDKEKDGKILSRVASLILESATNDERCGEQPSLGRNRKVSGPTR